jgi:transposase
LGRRDGSQFGRTYLPSYSPELNPDEYLNAELKARMNAGQAVRIPQAIQSKLLWGIYARSKNSPHGFVPASGMRKFAMLRKICILGPG